MVQSIAKMITLPKESTPIRYGTAYNEEATAIANPYEIVKADWSTGAATTIPAADNFACAFRCAERASVTYLFNAANQGFNYEMYAVSKTASINENPPAPAKTGTFVVTGQSYFPVRFAKPSMTFKPHGNVMFCGTPTGNPGEGQARFLWFDKGIEVTGIFSGFSAVQTLTVLFDLWNPESTVPDIQSTSQAGAVSTTFAWTLTVTNPGYYAIRAAVTTSATGALSGATLTYSAVNMGGTINGIFAHRPLPGYFEKIGSVDGIRISSVSLMYTNTTPEIYLGGQIAGFQEPKGVFWHSLFTDGFQTVSGNNNAVTLNVSKGMYGFLRPTQTEDFDVQRYVAVLGSELVDSFYPLRQNTAWLVMYANITQNVANQTGLWTYAFNAEFETEDTWFDLETAKMTQSQFESAANIIKEIPTFHENPLHLKDIWNSIKSGAGKALDFGMKYGPTIASIASMILAL
jgi:hypothetical protein